MKKTHFYAIAYPVFLLLFTLSVELSATAFSIEKDGIAVTVCECAGTLGDSLKKTTPEFKRDLKYATCNSGSYDPHNQLIYYTELEAGRVTFHVDAYYGQAINLLIENNLGEQLTTINMPTVDKNYLRVDLAAWECGKYYVLLTNGHGEVQEYSFVID